MDTEEDDIDTEDEEFANFMTLTDQDREIIAQALALVESTDYYKNHYEDLDWNITRSAYELREVLKGSHWVG